MANTLLTMTAITKEAQVKLRNSLGFTRNVNRQYDNRFAQTGAQIGDTLQLRLPNKYSVRTGETMNVQAQVDTKVDLVMGTMLGVDLSFSTVDMTLKMEDFSKRILEPAMSDLAAQIDYLGAQQYKYVNNCVGTCSTTPGASSTAPAVYLSAAQKLDENAVPRDGNRTCVINPAANASTVAGLSGLFNAAPMISDQYRKGLQVDSLGMNFLMSQSINNHLCGTFTGTITLNATGVEGASTLDLHTFSGTNSDVLRVGDVFTVADCYSINPQTQQSTGSLQQFLVTALTTASSGEMATLAIYPALVTVGPYATIDSLPVSGKTCTFQSVTAKTSPQNLLFHRDAFALVTADLFLPPGGADVAHREVHEGISMRLWRQGDIVNNSLLCRVDVLLGWKTVRPEMACRIWG